MIKFIVFLGLLVLMFSCAAPQEELGPGDLGRNMKLKNLSDFKEDEMQILSSVCEGLENKETYFQEQYADKNIVFNFKSQKKDCRERRTTNYITAAHVKYVNGDMTFIPLAVNAPIFNDIVLRNSGELQEFCDAQEGKSLTNRYILSGDIARVIYLQKRQTKTLVVIETAYDLDGDDEFEVNSKDQLLIVTTNNKWKGTVDLRSQESKDGCAGDEVSVLSTRLMGIQ